MLLRRYNLTLFNRFGKPFLTLRISGLVFLLPPLITGLLLAGNIALFKYLGLSQKQRQAIRHLQDTMLDQNEHLLENAFRIGAIERSLGKVVDFNAKLRIMLEIAEDTDRNATLAAPAQSSRGLRLLPALYGHNLNRRLWERMQDLGERMVTEEIRQQEIAHAVSIQLESLGSIPVIMPTQGRFSSGFGWRVDPFTGKKRFHKGIDLTASTGTPVRTTANGMVTKVTRSTSYGLVVEVNHNDKIDTLYAHMSGFAVEEGQRVLRGQVIGYVGNTGRSKAPHLHYEVHVEGKPVNPLNYILQ